MKDLLGELQVYEPYTQIVNQLEILNDRRDSLQGALAIVSPLLGETNLEILDGGLRSLLQYAEVLTNNMKAGLNELVTKADTPLSVTKTQLRTAEANFNATLDQIAQVDKQLHELVNVDQLLVDAADALKKRFDTNPPEPGSVDATYAYDVELGSIIRYKYKDGEKHWVVKSPHPGVLLEPGRDPAGPDRSVRRPARLPGGCQEASGTADRIGGQGQAVRG